jgi:hypothetical protein
MRALFAQRCCTSQSSRDTLFLVTTVSGDIRESLFSTFKCSAEVVYHYTNQAGLLGIIESGAIHAHSTRYVNDPTEGQRARSMWQEALESHPAFLDFWKSAWGEIAFESFCASFSLDGDLLSQWRGYAAGGTGFALGFHPKGFHPQRTTMYGCVLYDHAEQRALMQRTFDEHAQPLSQAMSEWQVPDSIEDASRLRLPQPIYSLLSCLLVYESLMKDSSYVEEREYRRVLLVPKHKLKDTELHFGVSARGIRPYVEMPFWSNDTHFLKEIVVGPSLAFDDTHRTLAMLLESKGYEGVAIRASKVPHRP